MNTPDKRNALGELRFAAIPLLAAEYDFVVSPKVLPFVAIAAIGAIVAFAVIWWMTRNR